MKSPHHNGWVCPLNGGASLGSLLTYMGALISPFGADIEQSCLASERTSGIEASYEGRDHDPAPLSPRSLLAGTSTCSRTRKSRLPTRGVAKLAIALTRGTGASDRGYGGRLRCPRLRSRSNRRRCEGRFVRGRDRRPCE